MFISRPNIVMTCQVLLAHKVTSDKLLQKPEICISDSCVAYGNGDWHHIAENIN